MGVFVVDGGCSCRQRKFLWIFLQFSASFHRAVERRAFLNLEDGGTGACEMPMMSGDMDECGTSDTHWLLFCHQSNGPQKFTTGHVRTYKSQGHGLRWHIPTFSSGSSVYSVASLIVATLLVIPANMPEGTMRALYYSEPFKFEVKQVPIPKCGDDDVLLKVSCCGVCGTDGHIHEGEFIAKFPLIPGHEAIGRVVEVGKNVKDFQLGDRVVADVGISVSNLRWPKRMYRVLTRLSVRQLLLLPPRRSRPL